MAALTLAATYALFVLAPWTGDAAHNPAQHSMAYAWALGALFFVMLGVSAWLGYQLAWARQQSQAIQDVQQDWNQAHPARLSWPELTDDLVWTESPEGMITSCSPTLVASIGIPMEKLTDHAHPLLWGGENAGVLAQYHQAVLLGSVHPTVDIRVTLAQDGRERIFEVMKTPIFDAHKQVSAVQSIARDVTLRRQQEQQLKAVLNRLRTLQTCVEQLNDVILISEAEPVDMPGPRIIYVNPAFERITGYSSAEVIGKTPRILQGPRTQLHEVARIRKALKSWQSVRAELINYTKSGREFWVELNINPVADETGYFTHWVAVQREITDRKL